jgi:hypothetical protein
MPDDLFFDRDHCGDVDCVACRRPVIGPYIEPGTYLATMDGVPLFNIVINGDGTHCIRTVKS